MNFTYDDTISIFIAHLIIKTYFFVRSVFLFEVESKPTVYSFTRTRFHKDQILPVVAANYVVQSKKITFID